MRGKRLPPSCGGKTMLNIPAYAGKTLSTTTKNSSTSEHPRVCGENEPDLYCLMNKHGTSPRMRGKLINDELGLGRRRNIPAYAGKTPALVRASGAWMEHPRVCGENPRIRPHVLRTFGTSPRMRGKLCVQCVV